MAYKFSVISLLVVLGVFIFTGVGFVQSVADPLAWAKTETKQPDAKAPSYAIVYADDASVQEKTAVWELTWHLRSALREWYVPVSEKEYDGRKPAIYVGWTRYAKKNGCQPVFMPVDAYEIKVIGKDIVLCGTRPRGNLYAVAEYLENTCGFMWFTLAGEVNIPKLKTLPLPKENKIYSPAFESRDFMASSSFLKYLPNTKAADRWLAMNRINGITTALHSDLNIPSEEYGGYFDPYRSWIAHTIPAIMDPSKYSQTHPEYFALNSDGKRVKDGYCLSNQGMREEFLKCLKDYIEKQGRNGIYSISSSDGGPYCECADCMAMARKYNALSAPYVDFVNYLAKNIAREYSGVKLELLAYGAFKIPPTGMACEPNVLVRFAPAQKFVWDSLDYPGNKRHVDWLAGWIKMAPVNPRVWDYPHVYGDNYPIFPVSRTKPGDPGLLAWVKSAYMDPAVASSGLCITMAEDSGSKHYFNIDTFQLLKQPTIKVSYQVNGKLTLAELTPSESKWVSSETPDKADLLSVQSDVVAAQVAGTPQSQAVKSFAYLMFDFTSIPKGAEIIDSAFELSESGGVDVRSDETYAVYAVRKGEIWGSRMTWNTRPATDSQLLFTLPAYKARPGFQGYDRFFPQPNLFTLLNNIKQYKNMGVKGIFLESDSGVKDLLCNSDVVYWAMMKGMWDTSRNPEYLVRDYCRAYYSKGGDDIYNYFKLLDQAYRQDPARVAYFTGKMSKQNFFTYKLALDLRKQIESAASKVAGNAVLEERVQRAGASLDIATLFYLNRFAAEYKYSYGNMVDFAFDRKTIEDRYTATRMKMIDRFYPTANKDAEQSEITKMFMAASQMPDRW